MGIATRVNGAPPLDVPLSDIDLGTWDERSLVEPLRSYASARGQHNLALADYNIAMSSLSLASGWDSAAPTGE